MNLPSTGRSFFPWLEISYTAHDHTDDDNAQERVAKRWDLVVFRKTLPTIALALDSQKRKSPGGMQRGTPMTDLFLNNNKFKVFSGFLLFLRSG